MGKGGIKQRSYYGGGQGREVDLQQLGCSLPRHSNVLRNWGFADPPEEGVPTLQ